MKVFDVRRAGIQWPVRAALMLVVALGLVACSSGVGGGGAPLSFGEEAMGTTNNAGLAILQFAGEDATTIQVSLTDADNGRPIADLNVNAVALSDGVFLWTVDPMGNWHVQSTYLPFSDFGTAGELASQSVVTVGLVVLASVAVYGFVNELINDPLGVENIYRDGKITERCLVGDLNDALTAAGVFQAAGTFSGVVSVWGAPADVRGADALHYGITNVKLGIDGTMAATQKVINRLSGILDTDYTTVCWNVAGDRLLPYFRIDVTRFDKGFRIKGLDYQPWYPITPRDEARPGEVRATWAGEPVIPLTMEVRVITCYQGWVCGSGPVSSGSSNPMTTPWGCQGLEETAPSGYFTYEVVLIDSNGVETEPVPFTFRCGSIHGESLSAFALR